MPLHNYGAADNVVTVNGREITMWGDTNPPITEEPIDPSNNLRRGLGGRAVSIPRINPGRRVTLHLNPGSPDGAYMQGLFASKATITYSRQQIGTLETSIGTEGIITNDATVGRAGTTISDDTFIMEFNVFSTAKGGD